MSVELYIHGIDRVVWEIWEILIVILVTGIVGTIVGFVGKIFWDHREQKKKLVPLMIDEAEYQHDEYSRSNSSEGIEDAM